MLYVLSFISRHISCFGQLPKIKRTSPQHTPAGMGRLKRCVVTRSKW